MIPALAIAALVLAIAVWALAAHADAYVRKAEARWPPLGAFQNVDSARLHVLAKGPADTPRILLIHGASANLRELWNPIGEPLSVDHHVVAFDRPGYGHSARPKRAEQLAVQARLAAGVLEPLGDEPALVIAHSLGAAVALRLALDFPERVRGLILLAPASHPYPGDNVWWARLGASPIFGPPFANWLVPWLGDMRVKGGIINTFWPAEPPPNYYDEAGVGLIFRPRAFRASARDVIATKQEFIAQAPTYPEIMAPAIIITGDKDKVVSPKIHARALAYDMAAAELVISPGAGHMPHRTRPDLVLAAVRRLELMAAPVRAD